MNLSDNAAYLIDIIENSGYEAFAVGGCVRDSLMGKPCHDIDITTSATPDITEEILKNNGIRFIETGLKHGTITALLDGEPYEITTYRTEGEYKDNRHPESVEFVTDISADLSRRDFTVNAMAYSHSKGLVDAFGGQQDLENGIIRAVGDPDRRFNEDALRIMRAIRFSSVLGFEIEDNTREAIFRNKELLKNISEERIFTELSRLLLGDKVFDVLMEYAEVLAVIIPEIAPMFDCEQNSPWHIYNVWEHTCKAIEASPKELKIRLTMLLHDIGKPNSKRTDDNNIDHFKGHQAVSAQMTSEILRRLKVSNEIYDYLMALIPIHDINISNNKRNIKKWIIKLGQDCHGEYYIREFTKLRRADRLAQNPEKTAVELIEIDNLEKSINEVIAGNEAISVSDLAVNGFDLMSLGIKGKQIGITLNRLLEMVIDETLPNDKKAMLKYIEEEM